MASADDFNWDDLRFFLRAAQTKTLAGAARAAVKAECERVRLSVPQALTALFTQALAQLRRDHPEVSLELISDNRPPDLKRGEADLAVLVRAVVDEDLVRRSLGDVGWSLYATEAYLARHPGPIDPKDLSGHEIVSLKADATSAPAAKWLAEHAAKAIVVSRSNASASLVAAAVAGAGLALLPCFLAEAESALKRLTPDVLIKHSVSLVYRREVRLVEPVRVVIRFVIDVMRKHADLMKGTLRH